MASKAFMVAVLPVIVAAAAISFAPAAASEAKDILVGDAYGGWKLDFDYNNWAAGKQFLVGDSIVFNYQQGVHNVIKVNKTEFDDCITSNTANTLSTGNDVINLNEPGKKWYICGVGDHCSKGMKLVIDVWSSSDVYGSAPAPSPSENPKSAAMAISPNFNFLSMMICAALTISFIILP